MTDPGPIPMNPICPRCGGNHGVEVSGDGYEWDCAACGGHLICAIGDEGEMYPWHREDGTCGCESEPHTCDLDEEQRDELLAEANSVDSLDLVREFHFAFGQSDAYQPRIDDKAINELRVKLLREETQELSDALDAGDPVAVLDALTDLQYVLDGAYLQLGFADVKADALAEVHRSNMSKLGEDGRPVLRGDGKILKGPNYSPPDLRPCVDRFTLSCFECQRSLGDCECATIAAAEGGLP